MSSFKPFTLLRKYKRSITFRMSYATTDLMDRAMDKLNERDPRPLGRKRKSWTTSNFIRVAIDKFAKEILEENEGRKRER